MWLKSLGLWSRDKFFIYHLFPFDARRNIEKQSLLSEKLKELKWTIIIYNVMTERLKFNSFESYFRVVSYLLFTYISMVEIKVSTALTFFHVQRIAWTVCNFSRLSKFWASTGYFFIFIGAILPWHFDRCNCKRYKLYNKD